MMKTWQRLRGQGSLDHLAGEAEFSALVQREHDLCHRSRQSFALVLFRPRRGSDENDVREALVETILERKRALDDLGWYEGQPTLLLRSTTREGAEILARDVLDLLRASQVDLAEVPEFEVRCFPEEQDSSDRGSGDGDESQRPVAPLPVRTVPAWKRGMDIAGSTVGLIVLAPVMLIVTVAIRLTSKGPIFFLQDRTGHGLRRFKIFKFRTMLPNAEAQQEDLQHLNEMDGPLFKSDEDPRLTPIGKFLRRASLDELPQLFNVLRGEMSLVGPRALSPAPAHYEPWQLRRFVVRPGLACTWQADRREETDFRAWMRSDLRYVQSGPTLRGDLALLVRIAARVISCRGGR